MLVVSGASGQVGSAVASALLAAGREVKVLSRSATHGQRWASQGAQVAIGDLTDSAFLERALQGASGFFVLQPPEYSDGFLERQRVFANNVAQAVAAAKPDKVVLLSSLGAHLPSGTGPIQGLYGLERALRESGAPLTSFRSCYFQDNIKNLLPVVRQSKTLPVFAPAPNRAFPQVSTQALGQIIAAGLLTPTTDQVIDVLGPLTSHQDVAQALELALDTTIDVVEVPRAAWANALMKAGRSPEIAALLVEMYDALLRGDLVPTAQRQVQATSPFSATLARLIASPAVP